MMRLMIVSIVLAACGPVVEDRSPCNEALTIHVAKCNANRCGEADIATTVCQSSKAKLAVVGAQVVCRCPSDAGAER